MNYNSLQDMMKAFPDEESCVKHLKQLRWPNGIVCPLCSSTRKIYIVGHKGLYKCSDCKKQFSVRKDTIFEKSHLPLRKWFAAVWLITSNRKGISILQLAQELGVTQKTALFMLSRLREVAEAMGSINKSFDGNEKNKHAIKKLHQSSGTVGKVAVADLQGIDS